MIRIESINVNSRIAPLDVYGHPRFGWTLSSDSVPQETYRILVSENPSNLDNDIGDVFDTKEVGSDRSFAIIYRGDSLKSRTEYFVKVIVKGQDGTIDSHVSSFETALSKDDWKGTWVGAPVTWNGGALGVRRKFPAFEKKIVKARAYVAGIGYHEFYVNGKKIGDEVLSPGVTDYDKVTLYKTYDITSSLDGDGDVVGFLLGYGWYGNRKVLAQFYVTFEDGEEWEAHTFCNYDWWLCRTPITMNGVYSGETYDARLEEQHPGGFSSKKLDGQYNHDWFGCIHSQKVDCELIPEEMPGIKVHGSFPGSLINDFGPSNFVYDIKQNIAGWCRIKVKGEKGTVVRFRHAETLKDDGHIDQTNLRTADQEDAYILKGEGAEEYAPRFTYHGFRYVEFFIDGKAEVISVIGEHVHSANRLVGRFSCSDPKLNRLHEMAVVTESNNQMSILTDCPQRDERFGWLNDLSTRVFQTVYNFDVQEMFRKIDRDISLVQDANGAITDTVPYYTGGRPADTTSLSYLLIALLNYRYYGDRETLRENYRGHKNWVEYLLRHSKNYIMDYYYYADWVCCESFSDAKSDGICISSVFLYWHLLTLAEEARILQKKVEETRFFQLAQLSKNALQKKYMKADRFHEGTQAEDAMALSLDLVPEKQRPLVYAHLRESIINHGYHITCGNQGYRHVMYLLAENGDLDILIKVLENPEYPGWGYMLENDATTVWERWEKENLSVMNSFDHPMFGSYDAVFYRYILGIRINDISMSDIEIKPVIPASLEHAEGSFETVRGLIKSSWRKENGKVVYEIELGPNVRAIAHFPTKTEYEGKTIYKKKMSLEGGRRYVFVGEMPA